MLSRMRISAVAAALVVGVGAVAGCTPNPELPEDDAARCSVERRTIQTALEAWKASEGAGDYPAELEELVGVFLAPDGIPFGWLYGTDGATYSLFGPC